ncbi:MAG TPA: polyprenyl diphosphate synthase [Roseomonas sp.]
MSPKGIAAMSSFSRPRLANGTAARPLEAESPPPPRHVAIIMDGNRRWAQARGLPVAFGHRAGAEAARRTIEAAAGAGITWLTLFAFSSENWQRPLEEVSALTGLLRLYLKSEIASLVKEGVRLRIIGDHARFGTEMSRAVLAAERATEAGTRLNLTVALSYGGRAEIVAAARAMAEAARDGRLDPAAIDEAGFAGGLQTAGQPDPDLIIRTSGEQRLSNFLLWQAAYAEFVFQDVLWPDYGAEHLAQAVAEFTRRDRRFGQRAEGGA